jgi:putative addiction module component (TIGR02574 family)
MASTLQSLGIDRMSIQDRLCLIEEIWESIETAGNEVPVPDSHREELDRRLEAADANPQAGIPWEEALTRLKSKP